MRYTRVYSIPWYIMRSNVVMISRLPGSPPPGIPACRPRICVGVCVSVCYTKQSSCCGGNHVGRCDAALKEVVVAVAHGLLRRNMPSSARNVLCPKPVVPEHFC